LAFADPSVLVDRLLDDAVDAINRGDRATADDLAGQVLAVDRSNPDAEELLAARAGQGEIQRPTMLFTDLVGSTALFAEPEIARTVFSRFNEQVVTIVERNGGHVFSSMGDGLMAVFKHPNAPEMDARRAVEAGLDITREFGTLSQLVQRQFGLDISVRVGVHRGIVHVDPAQEDVHGLGAVLTERVGSLAEPGTVAVSETIRRLVDEAFELEALPPKAIKDGLAVNYRAIAERNPAITVVNPSDPQDESLTVDRLLEKSRLRLSDAWARAISTYGLLGVGSLSEMSTADIVETEQSLMRQVDSGVLISLAVSSTDEWHPVRLFPAFQFDKGGQVLPVMSAFATRVAGGWDVETRLLWLTSPNGWLGKQAPADLLASEPDAVLRALDLAMSAV
jgi:class 3 adenylate cyclase